ncbi:MAG TPA: peptide MFS transporter [Phycisphaerae bacterium]|nr:peptide MFS transporter [Phycisphaerae bacterium]
MSQVSERQILGHPSGLFVLFFTELWERFNFYGMRALLIFYFMDTFAFNRTEASESYGAYNGLVYATPLLGGMLADKIIGYRRSIILGAILMGLGEFGLCFAGFGIIPKNSYTVFMSLALIIMGNGFFKPNISTLVGKLYRQGDPRRDGAFTIFYMGINIGAFLAPILCGQIGQKYGFHYGFGLAGLGMVLGLIIFVLGKKILGDHGLPPNHAALANKSLGVVPNGIAVYIGAFLLVPLAAFLVSKPDIVIKWAAPVVGGAFLVYILWEAARGNHAERVGIFAALILSFFSIVFWACFEQAGSSMNLFTESHVNRTVFGRTIEASVFQFVNAAFIVLLAPLFSWLWTRLGRAGLEPSSPVKFGLALIQVGVGFIALVIAANQATGGAKAALILLFLAYFFHTTGELCLSPVGLSMITKLVPARMGGLMMGFWFLCTAFAHLLGGVISGMTGKAAGFGPVFQGIVYFACASGVVLLILSPLIKKWERIKLASHHEPAPSGFPVLTEPTATEKAAVKTRR